MRSHFQFDHLTKRFTIALAYVTYFILSYKAVQIFSASYTRPIELALPFEALIPFVPAAFYFYLLAYLIPLMLMFISDIATLKKIMLTFIAASLFHYVIFLVWPISYTLRPVVPATASSSTLWLLHFFHQIDTPLNSFPSIHVSFVYMTYYFLKKYRPALAPFGHLMAYAVALSTLFVKQHYILDVLGGLTVAYAFNRFLISREFFDSFDTSHLRTFFVRKNET